MNHFYVNPVEVEIISKIFDSILGGTMYKSMLSEQGVEVSDEDVSMFTKALQIFVIGVNETAFLNNEKYLSFKLPNFSFKRF